MGTTVSKKKPDKNEKNLLMRIMGSFFFRLLGSLLLAVVVWLTINTTYINPPDTRKFNPALTLMNRSALDSQGIELVTETFRSTIEVSIIGRQEDIDRLTVGDFEAFIDFSKIAGVEDTELEVELRTSRSDNISIMSIEPSTIPIKLELRDTRTLNINVLFAGELPEGFYLTSFSQFPATRSFTARESLVNQIERVEVEIDLTGIAGNTLLHQQSRIFGVDGIEIIKVGWDQVVDISLEISKDVPVISNVTGSPAEDHYVRYITTTPETVRINGTKDALEQVDSLYTDTLDIANSRQSVSSDKLILMPNNVKLTNNLLPRAVIDVTIFKYLYTQDIALSKGRIELINNHEEYRYEIVESEIPLLLKGRVEDINNLDSSQVSAVIDVEGLTPGAHAVTMIVTLPEGIVSVNDVLPTVIVARN